MDARDGSPDPDQQFPPLRPPSLAVMKVQHDRARRISHELEKAYNNLSREVFPKIEPEEERIEPDRQSNLELTSLGIELALKQKEELRLEREVIIQERDGNIIPPSDADIRLRDVNKRYLSAGDALWRHQAKKARLDDPGIVRLLEPRSNGVSDCLLALYKKCDGLEKTKKRPSDFRRESIKYYAGEDANQNIWCQAKGGWSPRDEMIAAHIVPFFLDSDEIGEILFGSRAPDLRRAGNSLLLRKSIEKWFDTYHILIVPANPRETPIMRWRIDVISSSIKNAMWADGPGGLGGDLDGKELTFCNEKRPVSRFMYFHFVMALVRIKDVKRHRWQDVWAQYYQQRPFPTPGNYMRQSMLLALATHFGTVDMNVVESWIKDYGFESPLKLTEEETQEAARRVHVAVEQAIARANGDRSMKDSNSSIGDEDDDEDEDD